MGQFNCLPFRAFPLSSENMCDSGNCRFNEMKPRSMPNGRENWKRGLAGGRDRQKQASSSAGDEHGDPWDFRGPWSLETTSFASEDFAGCAED
jgi:hypothetical protein